MIQLNPAIWVMTPLGVGLALFLIDDGMHQNTCWVVALEKAGDRRPAGQIKHFDGNDIQYLANPTYAIGRQEKP